MSKGEAGDRSYGEGLIERYTKGLCMVRNHGFSLRSKLSGDGWRVVRTEDVYVIQTSLVDGVQPSFHSQTIQDQLEALEFARTHGLTRQMLDDILHLIPKSV